MGERHLRTHVQTLRAQVEASPGSACVQRINVEDNVVEFKIHEPVAGGASSSGAPVTRLNFLFYDVGSYPNCGGVMMAEDDRFEDLVNRVNERLGEPDAISIGEVMLILLAELGHEELRSAIEAAREEARAAGVLDFAPSPPSAAGLGRGGPVSDDDEDDVASEDLDFGGEDFGEDCVSAGSFDASLGCRGDVLVDREQRPGWKKLRWQEAEELRLQRKEEKAQAQKEPGNKKRKASGLTLEEQKAAGEQMWSSREAFAILANELYQLQTEPNDDIEADAIEYDVHRWRVLLRGCTGELGADLQALQARFGYDYVEIHLNFKEDLHPFYPPTVSLLRPRLHGEYDVLAALACHPRLQLKGWSPFQSTKALLAAIRAFLSRIARVDLGNVQNDMAISPEGAFSVLERQLARLGNLCEVVPPKLRVDAVTNPYKNDPWVQEDSLIKTCLGSMLAQKKAQKGGNKSKGYWAAGTGYGHDHGEPGEHMLRRETWDPLAMKAAQVAQDEELRMLVRSIATSVQMAGGRGGSGSDVSGVQQAKPVLMLGDLLHKSCVGSFLARELSISYTNIGERLPFFHAVLELLQEILNVKLEDQGVGVLQQAADDICSFKVSAQRFLRSLGNAANAAEMSEDVAFAKLAVDLAEEVGRRVPPAGGVPGDVAGTGGACPASSSAAAAWPAVAKAAARPEEDEYCARLKVYQLDQADLCGNHSFYGQAKAENNAPQARTLRLAKELAGLPSLLPLNASSSVFVRIDETYQQLWRALVTGPDDTPYSCGCFVFDIYFPAMYPNQPPRVKLLTTGDNTCSFNPNLYESGKVCLSLLGTWKGDKAESWDPTNSRIAQVLVSIQSLILVPEPYFNEPGYEREIGTATGLQRSRAYNVVCRERCVRWAMVDQLVKNRYKEFTELIWEHFRLREGNIRESIVKWCEQGGGDSMRKLWTQFQMALRNPPEGVPRLVVATAGSGEAPDEDEVPAPTLFGGFAAPR